MKKFLILPVLFVGIAISLAFSKSELAVTSEGKGISFHEGTLADAKKAAKESNKFLFVDVYAVWCGPCKLLKRNTFSDEKVGEYFNEKFVSTMVDAERGEGLALVKEHPVPGYPTMLIFDSEGNLKGKIIGYQTPEQLISRAKEIVE